MRKHLKMSAFFLDIFMNLLKTERVNGDAIWINLIDWCSNLTKNPYQLMLQDGLFG